MRKRLFAFLLCIVMVLSLIPTCAVAAADIASGSGWYIDGSGCLYLTGAIEKGYTRPWEEYKPQIKTVIAQEGSSVQSCYELFSNCENLVSADLHNLDVSDVVSMSYVFYRCSNLTDINFSGLDTSNVKEMMGLFSGCSSLTNLDISGLDTSNVTSMGDMFEGCSSLQKLDVSGFNTSNVTSMAFMFYNCSRLEKLDVSGFNTSNVKSFQNIFCNCSSLTSIDVSNFDMSNAPILYGAFQGCLNLTEIRATKEMFKAVSNNIFGINKKWTGKTDNKVYQSSSDFDSITGKYTIVCEPYTPDTNGWYIDSNGCLHITGEVHNDTVFDLDFTPWRNQKNDIKSVVAENGASINTCNNLFSGCPNLISVDLRNLDTGAVTTMIKMFEKDSKLKSVNLSGIDTKNVENMKFMFSGCKSLENVDLSGINTKSVETMACMFDGCSALKTIDISDFNVTDEAEVDDLFGEYSELKEITIGKGLNENIAQQIIDICSIWVEKDSNRFFSSKTELMSVSGKVTLMAYEYLIDENDCLHLLGKIVNTSDKSDSTPWKAQKNRIKTVVAEKGAYIENCKYLFSDCPNLTEVDLRNLDTSKVQDMTSMFENCPNLTYIDLRNIDTSEVKDVGHMFMNCSSLASLYLKEFDTQSVQVFNYMFAGCSSLTTLDLSSFNTHNAIHMSGMFEDCSNLKNLNIKNFNTFDTTYMNEMFRGCTSLTNVDTSALDTRSVISMDNMFRDCSSLYVLDISGFLTMNLMGTKDMLTGCTTLTELDINPDLLSKTAEQLITISPVWRNTEDNTIYTDVASLQAITGKVKLVQTTVIASGDGWALDELGNLFITGAVSNPTVSSDNVPWKDYKSDIKTVTAKPGASVDNGKLLFYNCTNLKTLDLTELDISGVVSVANMIGNCPALNTVSANPTVLSAIANQMISLSSSWVNVSTNAVYSTAAELKGIKTNVTLEKVAKGDGWYLDTAGVLHITGAVTNPSAYEDETPWKDYKNRIVSVVTTAGASLNKADYLFMNCPNLVTVDLSNLNASALNGFYYSFANCQSLRSVNFGNINTPNLKTLECMFMNDSSLESVDLSRLNTEKVWQFHSLFDGCSSLKTVYLGNRFVTAEAKYLGNMFKGCSSLQEIDVSSFDTSSITTMTNMFKGCSSLTSLDLSALNVDKVTVNNSYNYMNGIIAGCTSLEELRADSVLLGKIAPEVIALYPVWTNVTTGRIYTTAADLQAITGTATLVRDVPGDVTGDRKVDSADLTALLRHVAKIQLLGNTSNADLNKDGNIDAADVTALARKLGG